MSRAVAGSIGGVLVDKFYGIIFDHRIGEQILAECMQRGFIRRGIQFDLDNFPHTHPSDPVHTVVRHRLGDSGPLGIKHGKFGHNIDNSLHRSRSMRSFPAGFKQAICVR